MTKGGVRRNARPGFMTQGLPLGLRMERIVEFHGRTIRSPFDAPPSMREGGRARALARGRGVLKLAEETAAMRAAEHAAPGDPMGFANEELARFFQELSAFADQVEQVGDYAIRVRYVVRLKQILEEQEKRASHLLMDAPGRPYPHAIISVETSRRIPAIHHEPMRPRVESWSERPWIWEGRAWDTDRVKEQNTARQRDFALRQTGIAVPRPVLVTAQPDLEILRTRLPCYPRRSWP